MRTVSDSADNIYRLYSSNGTSYSLCFHRNSRLVELLHSRQITLSVTNNYHFITQRECHPCWPKTRKHSYRRRFVNHWDLREIDVYLLFSVIARAGMAWGQVTRWLHLSIAWRHILSTFDCPIYYPFHGLQLSKAYTQLWPKRDHVSSEARCLHQALHLSMCRKLLRHDWHLQDACRSLPQQLSLHGG